MKTKDLIKKLQEEDPSGELEVVTPTEDGWVDIYFVESLEGHYDGPYQLLVHDPKLRDKSYSIIGAQYRSDGRKVVLHAMGIKDAMIDNPDIPVEVFSGYACDEHTEEMKKRVEKWRKEVRCDAFTAKAEEIYRRFEPELLEAGHYGEHVYIDVDKGELVYVGKSAVDGLTKAQATKRHCYSRLVGKRARL